MVSFIISKKTAELFDFVTSYYKINKDELIRDWKNHGASYPKYSNERDETDTIDFNIENLPNEEKDATAFFFLSILGNSNINRNDWIEGHIKEYCIQKLNLLIKELSGHTKDITGTSEITLRRRRKGLPDAQIPQALKKYLKENCTKSAAYQYEVAFRNHLVPNLKQKTGEDFWEIKDLNRITAMLNGASSLEKTALKYYIEFLTRKTQNRQLSEKKKISKSQDLLPHEQAFFDFIIASGTCGDQGAYNYSHTSPNTIKKHTGFNMYNIKDPRIIQEWFNAFKIGKYQLLNGQCHHFPSTALQWYKKYLESNS